MSRPTRLSRGNVTLHNQPRAVKQALNHFYDHIDLRKDAKLFSEMEQEIIASGRPRRTADRILRERNAQITADATPTGVRKKDSTLDYPAGQPDPLEALEEAVRTKYHGFLLPEHRSLLNRLAELHVRGRLTHAELGSYRQALLAFWTPFSKAEAEAHLEADRAYREAVIRRRKAEVFPAI